MNVNPYNTVDYENKSDWTLGENKPNSNPIKPNLRNAKMNVNSLITKDYRKKDDFAVRKNKPNSNPILSAVGGLKMSANVFVTKDYENETAFKLRKNKPNQTQSEILNQKSQIHSHPAGNKLHTPRRQSWGGFDLSGWTTPKTAGLDFVLAALRYYSQTADKNIRA